MSEHIRNMIDALADKDFSSAKISFDAVVADKMTDALDARRIEIASQIYSNDNAEVEEADFESSTEEE